MPPKGSAKSKATAASPGAGPSTGKAQTPKEPVTPKPKDKSEDSEPKSANKSSTKPKTPRSRKKEKEPEKKIDYLDSVLGDATPIDVSFDHETVNGVPLTDVGGYGQQLLLRGIQPFKLITSMMLPSDHPQYPGHQAIIISTSRPFPFLELSPSVRHRIYQFYFAPGGKVTGKIDLTSNAKGLSSKTYSLEVKDAKERLGLLRVNKEIADQARSLLYSLTMRFDKVETLLTFLSCAGERVRHLLAKVELISWSKAAAPAMMNMLSECKNIQSLMVVGGFGMNTTPEKAAKQFHIDGHRFFQTMGALRGDRFAGVDMISFGSKCFTVKDKDEDGLREWDDDEVEDFTDALKAKLK